MRKYIQKGDKVYSGRRETISSQHHSSKYQLFRKMETVFSLGADGVQYRRNVTHVKRYLEHEDLAPKAESSDAIGDRDLAANLESQALKVPAETSKRPSEKVNAPECKQADATLAQSDSTRSLRPSIVRKVPSRYHDYVLGCIRLNPE